MENASGAHHAPGVASLFAAVIALAACLALPVMAGDESAQAAVRAFEIRIEHRRVSQAQRVLRATEGEHVELRWSADEPLVVHLHGYDVETRLAPGKPAVTAFVARLTGRFPVAIHAEGESKHRHSALLHVEIHPR
jgi:hypothetical protein